MNGDEGDGDCVMEVTMQFDDAEVDRKNAVERVMNRNRAESPNRGLGGLLGF